MDASEVIFTVLLVIPFVLLLGLIGSTLALRKSNAVIRDNTAQIIVSCVAGIVGCISVTVDASPSDALNTLEKEACAVWGYVIPYVFSYGPLYVILQWNLIEHSIWRTRISAEMVVMITHTAKSVVAFFTMLPIVFIVAVGWGTGAVSVDADGYDCESESWLKHWVALWAFTVTMLSSIVVLVLRVFSRVRISSISDEKSERVFQKAFALIAFVSILGAVVAVIRITGVHDTEWGRVAIAFVSGVLHVVYPASFVLSHIVNTFRKKGHGNWSTMPEGETEIGTAGADITHDLYASAMDCPMLRASFMAFCTCEDVQVLVTPGSTVSSRILVGAYKSACALNALMSDYLVMHVKEMEDEADAEIEVDDGVSVQSPSTFPGKINGTYSEGTANRVATTTPSSEVERAYDVFSQQYMNPSADENVSSVLQPSVVFSLRCEDVMKDVGNVAVLSSSIFGILLTGLGDEFLNVRSFDVKTDELRIAMEWVSNLRRLSAFRRASIAGTSIGFRVGEQPFANWEDFHRNHDGMLADGASTMGDTYYDGASSTTFGEL